MKFWRSVLTGMSATFTLLALFLQGVIQAFSLVLISVACTAGVALLIWIPLFFAVGWVILKIATWGLNATGLIKEQQPNGAEPPQAELPLVTQPTDEDLLAAYIQRAIAKGKPLLEIRSILQDQGWGEEVINHAIVLANVG